MDINDLFSHLNSVSNAIQTHWNFFSVVALGVATGLTIKVKKFEKLIGVLLIFGLGIFLFSNFYRISQTSDELKIVQFEIKDQIKNQKLTEDFKALYSNNYSRVNKYWKFFHIIIDLFLILIIYCRTEWRKQNTNAYQDGQPP